MASPSLLSLTLRRAPFCIFSKKAPGTLPKYNVDTDFTYFFFSDYMQTTSGFSPSVLTGRNGDRNAKSDFPLDYESYFQDDVAVCTKFPFPKVKVITEPWQTPAQTTIVETRKTCIQEREQVESKDTTSTKQLYMLGCFCPHDDIELGITKFRATTLPPPLDPLPHVPEQWYTHAFQQLPVAVQLLSLNNGYYLTDHSILTTNELAKQDFSPDSVQAALQRIQDEQLLQNNHDYSAFLIGGMISRLWIWRVQENILAVAFRRKHKIMPTVIEDSLTYHVRSMGELDDEEVE